MEATASYVGWELIVFCNHNSVSVKELLQSCIVDAILSMENANLGPKVSTIKLFPGFLPPKQSGRWIENSEVIKYSKGAPSMGSLFHSEGKNKTLSNVSAGCWTSTSLSGRGKTLANNEPLPPALPISPTNQPPSLRKMALIETDSP